MIIRVQSPTGTKRIECDAQTTTSVFYEKVQEAFGFPSAFVFKVYSNRSKDESHIILNLERKGLSEYNLKHGDMVYLVTLETPMEEDDMAGDSGRRAPVVVPFSSNSSSHKSTIGPLMDPVDEILSQTSGKIPRKRDDRLCQHNNNSACVHCAPLEPWDESYLKQNNVKHLSFHAYLRKLTAGQNGKFANLENTSCKIKPGCTSHPPYPRGICSKCQPSAIVLNQQSYRHVDSVMFENPSIVERFLNYWRTTGHQRFGFLYGRYNAHITPEIPLGIRATVAAIYEPPQESTKDSIRLLPDGNSDTVEKVAHKLGLQRVGWIFTDLIPEDLQKGTVKHLRNVETSHLLTAQECITAGHYQNEFPNACKLSPDGYFGSKFVTVCITGDKDNQVHMEGYQVSNQCMALVRDDCLVPTKDAPELAYVRESTTKQYVPDVLYKTKDEYGNEVTRPGRPLPVEYLLLDVPASTPLEPIYTFPVCMKPFPVENRLIEGHIQDIHAMCEYLQPFVAQKRFLDAVSDFHVLVYLTTLDLVPMKDVIDPLLSAVKNRDEEAANQWAATTEAWQTFEQIMQSAPPPSHVGGSAGGASGSGTPWTCTHCTFLNKGELSSCEMCSLPHQ